MRREQRRPLANVVAVAGRWLFALALALALVWMAADVPGGVRAADVVSPSPPSRVMPTPAAALAVAPPPPPSMTTVMTTTPATSPSASASGSVSGESDSGGGTIVAPPQSTPPKATQLAAPTTPPPSSMAPSTTPPPGATSDSPRGTIASASPTSAPQPPAPTTASTPTAVTTTTTTTTISPRTSAVPSTAFANSSGSIAAEATRISTPRGCEGNRTSSDECVRAANGSTPVLTTAAANEAGVLPTTTAALPPPYRSTYCRCAAGECQNLMPGDARAVCVPQRTDGSCPADYDKCVATTSYKLDVNPKAPSSVANVKFSLLAADIAGSLYNLGDANPITGRRSWWIAFRLPPSWRFVSWDQTTVGVRLERPAEGRPSSTEISPTIKTKTYQLRPCTAVTSAKNCKDDNVGFLSVMDLEADWGKLIGAASKAPIAFELEKSVVSGAQYGTTTTTNHQVQVFIVYEKATSPATSRRTRELAMDAFMNGMVVADGAEIFTGDLAAVPLATMEVPSIQKGRLHSSLLWVEVNKKKATLSFSTSTIIGRDSQDPMVCVNLRSSLCARRGRQPTANVTLEDGATAAYVKDGNPFIGLYGSPGDSPLSVAQVNNTFICVKKLIPSGGNINRTWEINSQFTFQVYIQGLKWSGDAEMNRTAPIRMPYLAEIALIDREFVQGNDCSQLIVHDQPYSNYGLSVYSVMSVTIYAVALVGAVLITRMNGVSFSAPTFYNDMTSVCVVMIFLLSIIGNSIWIHVSTKGQTTNASHIYFLIRIITLCFTWTMMTSVCFHWSTVLHHDVRKVKRVYLMLSFIIVNAAFYALALFTLLSLADFFKCTYDDYLKNPRYSKRLCDKDSCPDLQPLQWKYAVNEVCKDVPYSGWFFIIGYGTEILMVIAAIALLVLGTYVLRRGSRLIEHSGNMFDDRILSAMRKSLTTYLVVILAITVSLSTSSGINLILYTQSWSINAVVWYTFAIWLPTLVPPAGFLVLQWNPRLHGASMNQAELIKKQVRERECVDDDLKRTVRADSALGCLSDGWAGITDFPDTDYLPIGAETDKGSQDVLALSVQLITPQAIKHACFMELYVAESEGADDLVGLDEFMECPSGHPRASISSFIQSSLHRESLIQQRQMRQSMASTSLTSLTVNGSSNWVRVGFTETVLPTLVQGHARSQTQVAGFMSILQIPVMPTNPILRFVIYEIPDNNVEHRFGSGAEDISSQRNGQSAASQCSENAFRAARVSGMGMAPPSKPQVFCEFTCSSMDLLVSDEVRLVAPEGSHRPFVSVDANDITGIAPLLRVRSTTVSTRTLKENNGFHVSKCFQFVDDHEMVVEDMTETIFTNEIPRQFLEIIQKDRSADLARAESDLRAFEERCKNGLAGGVFENLIDQIQGENVQAVTQAWLEERVQQRSMYLSALKECQQVCVDRAEEGINFKASTEKKSIVLRFLPVNLHIQDMWVGPVNDLRSQLCRRTSSNVKVYTGVTVGAFAAHCFKFRHGSGILSLRDRLTKKLSSSKLGSDRTLTRYNSGVSDKGRSSHDDGQEQNWIEADVRADDELKWQLVTRTDMCVSQALTALVTSFCRNLEVALQHPRDYKFLNMLDSVGFLWQVESLLSTQGKEIGMLEDFYAAVDAMEGVNFILDTSPPSHLPPTLNLHIKELTLPSVVSARVSGDTRSGNYTVIIGIRCNPDVLRRIPQKIRDGAKISVTSVLFTQGINEMQTLANSSSTKKATLQDSINRESFSRLSAFIDKYKKAASHVPNVMPARNSEIDGLLADLEERIEMASKQMMKTKHPKIIQQSSRLCRLLGAGRVTSCKSAKDRTGMSVTLEQGEILVAHHKLAADALMRTISTMRSNGVRLENAFKNTGKRQYAFNTLQRSLLPEEYKCPEGTYGRGNVS